MAKSEFTLIDIDENDFVSLMDTESQDFKEIRLPEGKDSKVLCQKMRDAIENDRESVVCVLTAMDTEMIISCRENRKNSN